MASISVCCPSYSMTEGVAFNGKDQHFFSQENTFIGARRHRQQVCNTVLLYLPVKAFTPRQRYSSVKCSRRVVSLPER